VTEPGVTGPTGTEPVKRPNPLRWVGYAFGAGLPARNRTWVLHDVTARTWVQRHLLRSHVQIVPVAVVLYIIVPGDPTLRLAAITMGALVGLGYAAVLVEAATEHRVIKAGYPEGFAAHTRHERTRQEHRDR
jgi:hypothetical protein